LPFILENIDHLTAGWTGLSSTRYMKGQKNVLKMVHKEIQNRNSECLETAP